MYTQNNLKYKNIDYCNFNNKLCLNSKEKVHGLCYALYLNGFLHPGFVVFDRLMIFISSISDLGEKRGFLCEKGKSMIQCLNLEVHSQSSEQHL